MTTVNQYLLKPIFKPHRAVKLVYFFGSKARGDDGPLSDYDFALFVDERDVKKLYKLKFTIASKLSRLLKTDNVDVVLLNTTKSPELKYHIITEGKLVFERDPYRVLIEPRILNEYFDFHYLLSRYGLTKKTL